LKDLISIDLSLNHPHLKIDKSQVSSTFGEFDVNLKKDPKLRHWSSYSSDAKEDFKNKTHLIIRSNLPISTPTINSQFLLTKIESSTSSSSKRKKKSSSPSSFDSGEFFQFSHHIDDEFPVENFDQ
jgi:hypothetical protein